MIKIIPLIENEREFDLGVIRQLCRFIHPQSATLDPASYHFSCWIHDRTIARIRPTPNSRPPGPAFTSLVWLAEAGLSIRALADKARIAHSTISYIEQGRQYPSVDTVERLARALGVTACWLAYGTGAMKDGSDE